jgi:hypothetical protein
MSTTLQDSRVLAAGINALNARRAQRAEAAAGFIVAFVVALLLALALVHWAMPCEGASLCLAAVVPTQRSWQQRLLDKYEAWRLRYAIRCAQQDLVYQEEQLQIARWECEQLPQQQRVTQAHVEALQQQLRALGAHVGA